MAVALGGMEFALRQLHEPPTVADAGEVDIERRYKKGRENFLPPFVFSFVN